MLSLAFCSFFLPASLSFPLFFACTGMLFTLFKILLLTSVASSTLQFGISGTATAEATATATYAWEPAIDPEVSAFAKVKLDENPALTSEPFALATGVTQGSVRIPFNRAGIFHLIALDGNKNVIGTSDAFGVSPPSRLLADVPNVQGATRESAVDQPTKTNSPSSGKSQESSRSPQPNTPVIVGSVLGVVFAVLLGVVAFVIIRYRNRRRQRAVKEEMLARIPSYNFGTVISPAPSNQRSSASEPEKVRGTMFEFPTLDYSNSLRLSRNNSGESDQEDDKPQGMVTERQQEIEERIGELEAMIMSLRGSGGNGSANEDDLRVWKLVNQVESLKRLRYSPWALGKTDEIPDQLV